MMLSLPLFSDHLESEPLRQAASRIALGRHDAAAEGLSDWGGRSKYADAMATHLDLARQTSSGSITLVWRIDPSIWETDWIRQLFLPYCNNELVCTGDLNSEIKSLGVENALVIDNRLSGAHEQIYRCLARNGTKIGLIHLSDEYFLDDLSSYIWCRKVFRTCWSPILSKSADVVTFPLGFKQGFGKCSVFSPSQSRPLVWSFAGNIEKSSRRDMMTAMCSINPQRVHLADGFSGEAALNVGEYRAMMEDSIFVPCPRGNEAYETFRAYEALEAGCIPILEADERYDYYKAFLGEHPMPTVRRWADAPGMVMELLDKGVIDHLQRSCKTWWERKKLTLSMQISEEIERAFFRPW